MYWLELRGNGINDAETRRDDISCIFIDQKYVFGCRA